MRKFPETIIDIIEASGLNLNQISKISGISNTYLTKLVKKKINLPGKDKITSILLALNHTITDINHILADYDYRPLNRHDIPEILKINRRRKFEGRILPQYDNIYFELQLAAMEKIGGTKIVVKNRPSGIFIPMELYLMKEFPTESDSEAEQFFKEFTHDVVLERKSLFAENCRKGTRYETYICKKCFEESLIKNIGPVAQAENPKRVELFTRYIANAVSATLKKPEQHIHQIIKRCAYFEVQIQDADGKTPKINFTAMRKHFFNEEWDQLNLQSFLSDAPGITDVFFNEVERSRSAADQEDAIHTPDGFHAYIRERFGDHGLESVFDTALAGLMDSRELKFY